MVFLFFFLTFLFYRTDIEQEVNGVYAYDRRAKIDPARLKGVFDKGANMYLGALKE